MPAVPHTADFLVMFGLYVLYLSVLSCCTCGLSYLNCRALSLHLTNPLFHDRLDGCYSLTK